MALRKRHLRRCLGKKRVPEVDEMIESVEQDTEDIESGEREAKIYGVPKNRFLRLIEFEDGSHGKFRSKPGNYLKLGENVRVKHLDRDMWEVVRG